MLTAAYHLLGLEHEAHQFALEDGQLGSMSSNIRLNYAQFLLESGRFVEAENLLRQNLKDLGGDPGRSLELALCLIITRGIDDAEVGRLLDTAAGSTREPMSAEGARAVCLGAAYALDGNTERAEQLLELARLHPDDYHVRSAVAALSVEFMRREVNLDSSADVIRSYSGVGDPVGLARRMLDAADTPGHLQDAQLQLALALVYAARQSPGQQRELLAEAADHLRTALGAGEGAATPETDRMPDYDTYLLDQAVRDLRSGNPDFDTAIHHAVVDLLNQRRTMFKDVVELPPLEY
jgi:tetratricopeptide (TPR) repeat protein